MAVGEAVQQSLGTIDPSSLIGRADTSIVEPRATAMLADAFRQGVISAEDITARIGQLGQAKKKAEIDVAGAQSMQAQEAMSPEAQAARDQQRATQMAQGASEQAKAEKALVYDQYPAVKYFDELAAAAGITEPKNSDGTPDYKQMEIIGAELAVDKGRKLSAAKERENIDARFDADNQVVSAFTKQGQPVDPKQVRALDRTINTPFSRQAPGTSIVAPVSAAAPVVEAAVASPAPVVEARAPVALPFGTPVAGGYAMGGTPKPPPGTPMPVAVDPVKRAQDLAAAQSQISQIAAARAAVTRGAAVGPLEGSAPVKVFNNVAAAFGAREGAYQDQRDLQITLSQKVLEGAQLMKGNLSDKDIRFLEASVPKLKDTNNTWNTFLDRWDKMTKLNVDILSGRTPPSVTDLFAPKDWESAAQPTTAAPASAGTPPTVNSAAEAAALPATVQFFLTPDGRPKKNPNYRR